MIPLINTLATLALGLVAFKLLQEQERLKQQIEIGQASSAQILHVLMMIGMSIDDLREHHPELFTMTFDEVQSVARQQIIMAFSQILTKISSETKTQ